MSLGPLRDGPRGHAWTDSLGYTALGLAGAAALGLLLWMAAIPQAVTTVSQAGRPGFEAQVVACPQPGGDAGHCDVRLARDGQDVDAVLVRPGFYAPDVGDRLEVTVLAEADAAGPIEVTPAGARPWIHTLLLIALAATLSVWTARWFRRTLRLLMPAEPGRPDLSAEEDADDSERRRSIRRQAALVAIRPTARTHDPIRRSRVPRA